MPPDEVLEQFALSPGAFVVAFVLGTLFGSFANVCIYRWPPTDEHPQGRSVVRPGSHCGACGEPVRWYDNIPIVSYLMLGGQCRDCGVGFSIRYMLVEVAMGILFLAAYYHTVALAVPGEHLSVRWLRFLVLAAFLFVLLVIAFIDLDHKLILDKMTYPAIPIFYGLGVVAFAQPWPDGLLGAVVGYGVIRAVSDGYYHATGREGLGYGDGKLLAVVGALFGWKAVLVSLFAGSLLGSVIGISAILVARRRARPDKAPASDTEPEPDSSAAAPVRLRHTALPFGPFLAMGAMGYAFAEPWLSVTLATLWGTNAAVL